LGTFHLPNGGNHIDGHLGQTMKLFTQLTCHLQAVRQLIFASRLHIKMIKNISALCVAMSILLAYGANAQTTQSVADKLDADAYFAMAQRTEDALKVAKDKGGDPARFARTNPVAIHDAAGSEREVATLMFVLKSGADANVPRHANIKGGPIISAQMDLAKIELLIKAGADVNGSGEANYTALSNALHSPMREFKFPPTPKTGEAQRVYSKLDVVRFLLDAGAKLNDGVGATWRGGMLASTRKEDKDVIDLLVARGATLKGARFDWLEPPEDKADRGPLSIASMIGREDLAFAILRRSGRIEPNDSLALLHASRRGYDDLALALLQAGADPKAIDPNGNTSLMWARKTRDTRLVAALLKAGASDSPALPSVSFEREGLSEFDRQAALIIDDVASMDSPRFTLDVYLPKRGEPAFVLYGAEPNKFEKIACERASAYVIVANMNAINSIQVGVCSASAGKIASLLEQSRDTFGKLLNSMNPEPKRDASEMVKMGLVWRENNLPNGGKSYEFPILLIGHGVISMRTYVLVEQSAGRVVIVQASVDRLCEGGDPRTPLCRDSSRAFAEIASRVSRLPK
jgi:ankyrin repeat protein